jgi:hypothetical protein
MCLCGVPVVTDRPEDRLPLLRDVLRHQLAERAAALTGAAGR